MQKKSTFKAILNMLPYLLKYKWAYAAGFSFLIVINALGAYIPQLIKKGINLLEQLSLEHHLALEINNQLNLTILTIIGFAFIMAVTRTMSRKIIFGIGRSVEYDLKKSLFNHMVTMQPAFFTKQKTGDLISIITNDVQSLRSLAGFGMLNIANTIIAFAILIPLMIQLNTKLTLYFLSLIPLILFFVTMISRRLKKYQEIVLKKLGEITHFIEQNLSGIHIIKTYAQEDSETKRFQKENLGLLENYLKLVKYRSIVGPAMRVIASLGFILLIYIGGRGIINESFSLGDFAAYSLYIERLIWPVATLGWLVTVFYRATISTDRIKEILDKVPSIKDRDNALDKDLFTKEINLKKLGCTIQHGSTVGIVGTIGSGKTILANKMMHLIELEDDEILIDDVDIKDISLNSLRSLINLVPQDNFLFSTTIKENIAYAQDLSDEEIMNLAKLTNVHDEIMSFPDQYETVVGERGITLSGGQRQRLAIARALAINPKILVLDDALSSVDNETATKIFHNIQAARQGKTTIFVTHKIHSIKDADKIIAMDKLKINEFGQHDELIQKEGGIYKMLWETYHE